MAAFWDSQSRVKKWQLGGIQQATDQVNRGLAGLEPYKQGGELAYGATLDALGLNGQGGADRAAANFQNMPGYQFQLDQGIGALDRSAAARGMLQSGAQMKATQAFGQGLADQGYQQYLGNLGRLSAGGMQAAGQELQARQNLGNTIAGGYGNIGNAQAAQQTGYIGLGAQLVGSGLSALAGGMGGMPGMGGASGGMGGASASGGSGGLASLARLFMGG